MSDTGKHLSHRGKFLGLNELFLQTLEIGDVAAGENHAFNIASLIGERAEIETNPSPLTQLVAHADFQRGEDLLASDDVLVERQDSRQIFRMGATAKFHLLCLFNFIPKHVFTTGADKGVVRTSIEHQDEIGEIEETQKMEFGSCTHPE